MLTITNEDNMTMMARYPDGFFDLGFIDPPYFSGPEKRGFYGSKVSKIGVNRVYEKSEAWQLPDKEFFDEMRRVCKYYIVWGFNYFDYNFNSGTIVWDKCNDSSDYSDCELAATNIWDHTRIFRFMWNGMLQGSLSDGRKMNGDKSKNEKRIHPTQKPVQLYRWQLKKFLEKYPEIKNPKVLDTHTGSGSSAIACHDFGIDMWGCDIDTSAYNKSMKRIDQHIRTNTKLSFDKPSENNFNQSSLF